MSSHNISLQRALRPPDLASKLFVAAPSVIDVPLALDMRCRAQTGKQCKQMGCAKARHLTVRSCSPLFSHAQRRNREQQLSSALKASPKSIVSTKRALGAKNSDVPPALGIQAESDHSGLSLGSGTQKLPWSPGRGKKQARPRAITAPTSKKLLVTFPRLCPPLVVSLLSDLCSTITRVRTRAQGELRSLPQAVLTCSLALLVNPVFCNELAARNVKPYSLLCRKCVVSNKHVPTTFASTVLVEKFRPLPTSAGGNSKYSANMPDGILG